MDEAVSLRFLTANGGFRSQANLGGICGELSSNGTGFSPRTIAFPRQVSLHQYSIPSIPLLPTLNNYLQLIAQFKNTLQRQNNVLLLITFNN